MSITPAAAYQLLRGAGFNSAQAITMTAIGQAESGLDPNVLGDTSLQTSKWGPSVGIWQIRTLKAETGKGTSRDLKALRGNPQAQARAARAIYQSQGLRAWSVYTSGAYLAHLGTARKAAGSSPAAGNVIDPGPTATAAGLFGPLPNDLGDLNPLNWPGAIAHGFGDAAQGAAGAAGDAVTAPFRFLWSVVQPFFVTSLFASAGLGIILIGAAVLAKPAVDAVNEKTQQATGAIAPMMMMAV